MSYDPRITARVRKMLESNPAKPRKARAPAAKRARKPAKKSAHSVVKLLRADHGPIFAYVISARQDDANPWVQIAGARYEAFARSIAELAHSLNPRLTIRVEKVKP